MLIAVVNLTLQFSKIELSFECNLQSQYERKSNGDYDTKL